MRDLKTETKELRSGREFYASQFRGRVRSGGSIEWGKPEVRIAFKTRRHGVWRRFLLNFESEQCKRLPSLASAWQAKKWVDGASAERADEQIEQAFEEM